MQFCNFSQNITKAMLTIQVKSRPKFKIPVTIDRLFYCFTISPSNLSFAIQLIQGCENIFPLVSLSKSKFFTRVVRVALVPFVYLLCRSCLTRAIRVWHSCCKIDQIKLFAYLSKKVFENTKKNLQFLFQCYLCCLSLAITYLVTKLLLQNDCS